MLNQLSIDPDGGERLRYDRPDFPVRCICGDLSHFPDYAAGCHWHKDFEVLMPYHGNLEYFVNGKIVPVLQGQAIFVNSRRLHYGFSSAKEDCQYFCLVFHPDIFGSPALPTARYAAELARDDQPDYQILTQPEPLRILEHIRAISTEKPGCYELTILADCAELVRHCQLQSASNPTDRVPDSLWFSLRQMVGYIQANYPQPIRLEDIAAAGMVCRSKCCKLFQENMATTPIRYLNRYRLEKARELLLNTENSVTEIAHHCGFDSPAYFSDQYRKTYGESPRETQRGVKRKK